MKKLLVLLLLLPLAASARMFPTEFPIKAVCWDSVDEALEYHQEILGEYPIGKGWIESKDEPSFAAIMYNPVKPSWTFLSFHKHGDAVVVCAITGGSQWEILSPGEDKIQL
tara:strand:+ start:531 stop:863 length:333 start_codon:yes stop_codon:yes gene_type:complete